jgi:hypothetical protein
MAQLPATNSFITSFMELTSLCKFSDVTGDRVLQFLLDVMVKLSPEEQQSIPRTMRTLRQQCKIINPLQLVAYPCCKKFCCLANDPFPVAGAEEEREEAHRKLSLQGISTCPLSNEAILKYSDKKVSLHALLN